ncbi:hypothetical protein CERSUDRAFT_115937 [Gelatoporia subvermispora B]|uniref:F-box domain-containing protein n=1 Tax=Ceriporiopsis subvermispora (strain B) TaxID=914234 RepID=M2PIN2_CERS8|nr:hypothetical protein CERSUDRAFT_115937 [Gelatoporia subvermispora B]
MSLSDPGRPLLSVLALPTEIAEHIFVFTAAGGYPTTIAAVAQTCRTWREIVYQAADQHLWRELFLAIFDDPRVGRCADKACYSTDEQASHEGKTEPKFDWGDQFRRRIWAAKHIRRTTQLEDTQAIANAFSTEANTRALEALLSAVHTALPFPPQITCPFSCSDSRSASVGDLNASRANPAFPIFPPAPPPSMLARRAAPMQPDYKPDFAAPSSSAPAALPASTDHPSSRNIAWAEDVLARGFPPALATQLAGDAWAGGLMGQFQNEDEKREMQALGRVVAYTGFLPVLAPEDAAPEADASASTGVVEGIAECSSASSVQAKGSEGSSSMTRRLAVKATYLQPPPNTRSAVSRAASADMSAEAQLKRARRLARMRVYNMRYLTRERHWGPYLPVPTPREPGAPDTPDRDELLEPILQLFASARRAATDDDGHAHGHEESEDDDNEYVPAEGGSGSESQESDGASHDEGEGEGESASGSEEDTFVVPPAAAGRAPPPPELLRPDWAYLAAVRVVIEANLREAVKADDLAGLVSLDGLRTGSAPWNMDMHDAPPGPEVEKAPADEGKGKGKEVPESDEDEVEGYDWAGVTGIWRRCICWLDYRDLILHNVRDLSSEFNDPRLQEAVRIVPMRLRAVKYTRPTNPAYPDRPTIHIWGETAGSGQGHVRRIKGTVCTIADGSIRWCLTSSVDGGQAEEWTTEGVQLGGVASAMGILGLWTGVQHDRMDPLGPFWAWKVG